VTEDTRVLLADIGSTFTKVCLIRRSPPELLATAAAPTTVTSDVRIGFENACSQLNTDVSTISERLVCSSAAGGLRIVAVGLVPEFTLKAAKMAALGAGGKVIRAFSYRLTESDLDELKTLRPDVLLLTGGTDGGDQGYLLENAKKIQAAAPDLPLIVAGNRDAKESLRTIFKTHPAVRFVANVMPELRRLNLAPASEAIRDLFLSRIVEAKGISRVRSTAKILMPTPMAVLKAITLLSKGLPGTPGLGELFAVDMGGATTDVYSCATGAPEQGNVTLRGLPEPFEKRTVEGDIGMRHTLHFLLEELSLETFCQGQPFLPEAVKGWVARVQEQPDRLPQNEEETLIDCALAAAGCLIAAKRHCGKLEEVYLPEGRAYLQEGKDLAKVSWILGSGGPLVKNRDPKKILLGLVRRSSLEALLPVSPGFLLDQNYILWAMGLLAEADPACAFALLKRHLLPLS